MAIDQDRKLYLDGWRGVSIIFVLLGHFSHLPVIQWGTLGVAFFFALSGRLMGEIIFVRRFPVAPFLIRRFSRVWPVLFIFVLVMFVVSRDTTVMGDSLPLSSALTALTFIYGYARLFGVGWHAIEHVWSLCIEEHCYLILLSVAVITARDVKRSSWLLLAITMLSISDGIFRALVLKKNYFDTYWFTDASLHFITVPALAYIWRGKVSAWIKSAGYSPLILIIIGVAAYYRRVPFYITATVAPFFLGGAVVMLPHSKRALIATLENKFFTCMGMWSYSIYIWQQPFMVASERSSVVVKYGFMILAILVGAASYYTVERPARSFINRRFASGKRIEHVPSLSSQKSPGASSSLNLYVDANLGVWRAYNVLFVFTLRTALDENTLNEVYSSQVFSDFSEEFGELLSTLQVPSFGST